MTDWHRDHGSLPLPTPYEMRCDVPGCRACIAGPLEQDDITSRQATRAVAEANGWYVARDRGAKHDKWDLCPEHAPHALHVGRMR